MQESTRYKKNFEAKRFKYDQDRDSFQRSLQEMIRTLRYCAWLLLGIGIILGAIFLHDVVSGLVW